MFYGNNVGDTRTMFFDSWQKYLHQQELTPLETQLVAVIKEHPEYQQIFDKMARINKNEQAAISDEINPFLHFGLHLAVRDQLTTNRPLGISDIYQQLIFKYHDSHQVEHLLMEVLANFLWHAQERQTAPDEAAYLESCRKLI